MYPEVIYTPRTESHYYLTPRQVRHILDTIDFENVPRDCCEYWDNQSLCLRCRNDTDNDVFNIRTLEDFQKYIETMTQEDVNHLFHVYHPDGYTFLHRLCWNYAKERHSHRDPYLASESLKIMYWLMETYSMDCKKWFEMGTELDSGNTPMHEYLRNLTVLRDEDYRFISDIKTSGVNLGRRDEMGMSVYDYIYFKKMPEGVLMKIRKKQGKMKQLEMRLYDKLYQKYPSHFHKCKKCGTGIHMYQDLDHLSLSQCMNVFTEEDVWNICKIIQLREKIAHIYNRWSYCSEHQNDVHLYCIHVWKRKLLKLPFRYIDE